MEPQDRRYTKEHEWVQPEGDRARVGITDYAQKQLGDVVFLELPEVGRTLKAHEVFGTVESVKAVSELFAPVSGEVVEVNSALTSSPEKINSDPYGSAWMIVVRMSSAGEVSGLLDAAAYHAYVESESK
jgi:glycine cleavage system H protein